MAELVIPTYQVALLKEKALLGGSLSSEEQELVEKYPQASICEYLNYMKQVRPKKFEKIVNEVVVTPIRNYRQNYELGQILIKAWESGLTSKLSNSPELEAFNENYKKFHYTNRFISLTYVLGFGAYNVISLIPRFSSMFRFVGKNLAFYLALSAILHPIYNNSWRSVTPYVYDASMKHKNELEELYSKNLVLYKYPKVSENFPPDAFESKNYRFLADSVVYEQAHKEDFDGVNRRHSKWALFKSNKWRIDEV